MATKPSCKGRAEPLGAMFNLWQAARRLAWENAAIRTLLVIAHPGHELCLHTWRVRERPWIVALTAASRSGSNRSRLDSLLDAQRRLSDDAPTIDSLEDRLVYKDIMAGEGCRFAAWMEALKDLLVSNDVRRVIVDAWQGYSPAHDLVHALTHAAVAEAEQTARRPLDLLEFAPVPEDRWPRRREGEIAETLNLTEEELVAKRDLALAEPDLYFDLKWLGFLEAGSGLLNCERLYRVDRDWGDDHVHGPWFEQVGRLRVSQGRYAEVLTGEHLARAVAPFISRAQAARAQA